MKDIKTLVRKTGLTQKEFAEKIRISMPYFSRIVNRNQTPGLQVAILIVQTLRKYGVETSVEELWG